jgi:hypothetical protein
MPRWDLLDALARRQYGLIAHWQLLERGFSRDGIRSFISSGRLVRFRHGVYRLCGSLMSWNASVLAVVLAAGDGAVASHRTAGAIWQLLEHPPEVIEITAAGCHRLAGVKFHRHALDSHEITRRAQIPVTTIERTLLDLAESMEAAELGKAIDSALRRSLTNLRRLETVAGARAKSGRRRSKPFVDALAQRGAGYDPGANDWELRMDRLWDELGLPPAERQYTIRVGGHSYRVDRAIPSRRIAIEWNGYSSHGTRSSFDYDAERKARLGCAGWRVLEFTPATPPGLIRKTVLAVFDERSYLEQQ